MTLAEAVALIKASAQWAATNGDVAETLRRWVASNRGEAVKATRFTLDRLTGTPAAPPALATKLGQGATRILEHAIPNPTRAVAPPPPAASTLFRTKGAFVQAAGAVAREIHEEARIKAIAVQITSLGSDNPSTLANAGDASPELATFAARHPYAKVLGWGTHDIDVDREVAHVAARIERFKLVGYIADTERHWLNGRPELTELLLRKLRERLGPTFPLAVVSFCYSTVMQGQVWNSGYAACLKHGVDFIGEAYDADGVTYGLNNVLGYVTRDGLPTPARFAIGSKTIADDLEDLRALVNLGKIDGAWQWTSEQTGEDLKLLAAIPL